MKTKLIITIAFAAILSVLPVNAQKNYLPVFGEGVTRFYTAYDPIDTFEYAYIEYVPVEGQANLFKKTGDGRFEVEYISCDYIRVSEDNSKLWGYYEYAPETEVLLMDLNLKEGEFFEISIEEMGIYNKYTVQSVYEENGRKIIEFDHQLEHSSAHFKFIEGIGSYMVFSPVEYSGPELRAQSRDGKVEYRVPEWEPECTVTGRCHYCLFDCDPNEEPFYCTLEETMGINKVGDELSDVYLHPSAVETTTQLYLPKKYSNTLFYLTVSTAEGKTVISKLISGSPVEIDMHSYPEGIYFLHIAGNDLSKIVKFVKR